MKNKKITHNLARATMTLLALLCCLTGAWAQLTTMKKGIAGYGNGEGCYYLIASPVGDMRPDAVDNMLNDDFDLYSFDQNEGLEWRNYKAESFNLESGKGYLYASKVDVTLTFTGTPYEGNGEVTLDLYENADFPGWNLVGNPFAEDAFVEPRFSFYRMNGDGTEIIANDDENNKVEPMEGIFVIAEEDGETMTFSSQGYDVKRLNFALNISQNKGIIDRAIVSFDEGRLLPKFQLKETSTKIFIPQENGDFALVRGKVIDQLPVSFKAQRDGSYTLSLSDTEVKFNYLHLVDLFTGNDVDLLANPSYTFNARSTDDASRFRLDYAANNVPSATSPIHKESMRGVSSPKLPAHGLNEHQDAGGEESDDPQYETHWPEFNYYPYLDNKPVVAFVQINGEYITQDNYAQMEVAAFVGEECRGHMFMDDYTEDGDPYPIVELNYHYTNTGEEVTFKLYDHATGIEYELTPNKEIHTGDEDIGLYFDYDDALVLSFVSPNSSEAYAVLSEDGTTLTFYYDANKPEDSENVFDVAWDESDKPIWNGKASNVETVEFTESFGDYHGLTSTRYMFSNMKALTTINGLEYLNTENVKNMEAMFNCCEKLTTLDLSNFNTEIVENMHWMFEECLELKMLDLSSFVLANATTTNQMFSFCSKLETIYTAENADWTGIENTENMFFDCSSLSGKYGSKEFACDGENNTDGTYAKVFNGSNEGYFTYKGNRNYKLEVTSAGMATLYLDFPAQIPKVDNGDIKVYYCTGLDDGEAYPTPSTYATQIKGVIPAHTGVFVMADPGVYVFDYYFYDPDETPSIYPDNILMGSTKETQVEPHEVLTLGHANNEEKTLGFWWFTAKNAIPANRAWIPGSALEDASTGNVKGVRILFGDEADAIDLLPAEQTQTDIYDLQGRKMEGKNLPKGLYIVNGRKVIK